jgi:hypothetical protein
VKNVFYIDEDCPTIHEDIAEYDSMLAHGASGCVYLCLRSKKSTSYWGDWYRVARINGDGSLTRINGVQGLGLPTVDGALKAACGVIDGTTASSDTGRL